MDGFHAVVPKLDCPHALQPDLVNSLLSLSIPQTKEIISKPCTHCDETYENWVCLTCGSVECSRYKNGHMKDHNEETQHPFALSLVDFSCWCYSCNDYIESPSIKRVHDTIYLARFDEPPQKYSDDAAVLYEKVTQLADLIQRSRKIVFFTGNGINTAAIVPDETSPVGSPNSNSLFEQSSTRAFNLKELKPTYAHKALKVLCDTPNTSHLVVTTNPDDLHQQAAIRNESLLRIEIKLGEEVKPEVLQNVVKETSGADLYVVIGSSMRTSPSNQIPALAKQNGGKLVIINVQNTLFDNEALLRIWAPVDDAMIELCKQLSITIPE